MDLSLAELLMAPQKKLVPSAKFTILISWSPLSVHLQSFVISVGMDDDFGCNNIEKHGEWVICKTTYMKRVEGSERRPCSFTFRFNIILHDSYQVDKSLMEI